MRALTYMVLGKAGTDILQNEKRDDMIAAFRMTKGVGTINE